MKQFPVALLATTVILLLAATCRTSSDTPETQPAHAGANALIGALRTSGLEPRQVDRIKSTFFMVPATVYAIRGGELQVYEYPTEERAAREAAQVSADGSSIGTSKALWIAPPHFFRAGALLVLYLGSDGQVLEILRAQLGPPFAGR